MKTKEEIALMKVFLSQVRKLSDQRKKDSGDNNQEYGTYNSGYWDALTDISKIMISKTGLN